MAKITSTTQAPTSTPEAQAPEAQALTVEALSVRLGASPKDVRRWLRSQTRAALGRAGAADVLPGKGGRYAFTPEQAEALVSAYGRTKGAKGTQAPAQAILSALAPEAPTGA